MFISYNILKNFVTPPDGIDAKKLADVLTMSTVEVEDWVDKAQALDKVVVGLVKAVKQHPNADKLKLASVDVGGKTMEVVCGGVNLKEGMKIAFAHAGARVKWHGEGDWTILATAKIRGVESSGMACAAGELGLPDTKAIKGGLPAGRQGIMDLSHVKAKPGTPLAEALAQDDIILDIDNKSITHRPDLWGHVGLARELAAIWKKSFALPKIPAIKPGREVKLKVTAIAPEKAERYMAVALRGIKIGPSPEWLVQALENLGMRSINNVVDVTNYVMLELGQPLHAFDLKKLASPEIIVRVARNGEKMTTLDGVERKLDDSMLVIADIQRAQAIAGVMGGSTSEVSEATTNIVLESATFEAVNIRKTATKLGLRTEASARFEKALDPNLAELALQRAVQLLQQVSSGCKVASQVADAYIKKLVPQPILLPLDWLTKKLGVELPVAEVKDILKRLGFTVTGTAKQLSVTPPTWRATRDITIPEDLVEEVARIHGYDKIPLSMPKFDITPPARDEAQELRWKIRDLLIDFGWVETLTYSFVDEDSAPPTLSERRLELLNPVDLRLKYLRSFLFTNLVQQVATNAIWREGRKNKDIKMYEIGRVFDRKDKKNNPTDTNELQGYNLALCASTQRQDIKPFRELRGVVEAIFSLVGVNDTEWRYIDKGIEILSKGEKVGLLGENNYIDEPFVVTYAEIDLDWLQRNKRTNVIQHKSQSKYSAISRDISIIISGGFKWVNLESGIKNISGIIEEVELFDTDRIDKNIIGIHIIFRALDRTLKSEEVDEVMQKVTKLLQDKFNAVIR